LAMYFSKFKSFSLIILLLPNAALSKCKFLLEFDELAINESGENYAAVGKIKIPISEDLDSFEFLIETDLPLTKLRVKKATTTRQEGNKYKVSSSTSFKGKKSGNDLKLNFKASFTGDSVPSISSMTLNGEPVCLNTEQHSGITDYYTGAVVEYNPNENCGRKDSAEETMICNVDQYEKFMANASEYNVDIIVFPEYGITGVDLSGDDRQTAKEFMVQATVGENYCEDEFTYSVLNKISCYAKKFSIYTVVNMGEVVDCPEDCQREDKLHFYNTNFVFDRSGMLIAKYWKRNLFLEPTFDFPSKHQFTYFETDFGVTFGTFICFDALWSESMELIENHPSITDIVYSTAWVAEMPFMTAPQQQNAWAAGNNVNFLASNYHEPAYGNLGSGIYSPSGPLNYTYDASTGSNMVIAQIPKLAKQKERSTDMKVQGKSLSDTHYVIDRNINEESGYNVHYEDLSMYSSISLEKGNANNQIVCHNEEFCCHISYKVTENVPDVSYKLIAYKGDRATPGGYVVSVENCGVVMCKDDICGVELANTESLEEFEYLELSGVFSDNAMILPSVLEWSGMLPDWDMIDFKTEESEDGKDVNLSIKKTSLFSVALYGRLV